MEKFHKWLKENYGIEVDGEYIWNDYFLPEAMVNGLLIEYSIELESAQSLEQDETEGLGLNKWLMSMIEKVENERIP